MLTFILGTFTASWLCIEHSSSLGSHWALISASQDSTGLVTCHCRTQLGESAASGSVDGAHPADSAGRVVALENLLPLWD